MPGAMKTRPKKPSTRADGTEKSEAIQRLEPSVPDPPRIFILPKDISTSARVLTLPNPATSSPNRYLLCPAKGFYEFTRIAASKRACRSWLLAPCHKNASPGGVNGRLNSSGEGYVLQSPDMMVATPIDPLFFLLPALTGEGLYEEGGRRAQEFLSASDYVARMCEESEHFKQIMQSDSRRKLESMFEARMHAVCDGMDAGDERLYTLSKHKMLLELVEKARRMAKNGLPASMEERFVKRELVVPVLSVKREESSISIAEQDESTTGDAESQPASQSISQVTLASESTSTSMSTTATSVASTPADYSKATNELTQLLRLRTALSFLLNSYISKSLRTSLEALLRTSSNTVDFAPLDKHLAHINQLKKEAQALRSMSDNISRKRSALEDDEASEKVEAKKRKKEEDEIKKKNMSRGVQQLKKADTSGMKKMSAFFTAKAPAKQL